MEPKFKKDDQVLIVEKYFGQPPGLIGTVDTIYCYKGVNCYASYGYRLRIQVNGLTLSEEFPETSLRPVTEMAKAIFT